MKRVFYSLAILFMILPFGSVNAACSGSDCCTITSGVITAPDNGACAIQPSTYGITLYDKYLCTGAITAPTTSSNADLTGCVRTFQSTAGSVVRITSTSDQATFSDGTFTRPPPGVYTHGVMVFKNVFLVKLDMEFNTSVSGNKSGAGVYCHTVEDTKYEDDGQAVICSSSDGTAPGELGAGLASFEGRDTFKATAEASNLNGTGADMKAWLLDSSGNLAETRTEAEAGAKLLGEATFATPVVVTEMTQGFNMAFQINQGATIWDENGTGGAYSIGVGSGPFMVIITPLNY
jgi:hypothetical protein